MNFSFIIPVYNCRQYLRNCVESIINARVPSFEILLIDDGSTDGSSELCDSLALDHSQIRVLHQKNAGVASARNAGLHSARGEYILFVDADDSLDSGELKKMLADPRITESDLTLFGIRFDYYRNGHCYRYNPLISPFDGIITSNEWPISIDVLFQANCLSSSCTKIFKRSILEKNNLLLNTSMFLYEDLEFVLRYLACCGDIWNVPKAIYHYRQSEDEGNAGRRLARIDSIPDFLVPIEAALSNLQETHPAVPTEACQKILQQLHLILAREKIAVSSLSGIRNICRDYASWEKERISHPADSKFRQQLLAERCSALWFHHKKTAVRHRIAVFVKSTLHVLR